MKKVLILILLFSTIVLQASWQIDQEIKKSESVGFGRSVDVFDQFLAVGAPWNEDGTVYIYRKDVNSKKWSFLQKIERPVVRVNEDAVWYFDSFGTDVALSGMPSSDQSNSTAQVSKVTLVAGAPLAEYHFSINGQNFIFKRDALLVYDFNVTTQKFELQTPIIEEDESGAGSAVDVAMVYKKTEIDDHVRFDAIGRIVVTGMYNKDMIKVYIEEFDDNNWKDINFTSNITNIRLGESVAIGNLVVNSDESNKPSYSFVVAGAPDCNETIDGTEYQGRGEAVALSLIRDKNGGYTFGSGREFYLPTPQLSDINEWSRFGSSIALDSTGRWMIVGSWGGTSLLSKEGEAYVFHFNDTDNQWKRVGNAIKILNVNDIYDGVHVDAVAIENNIAIIGMPELRHSENPCSMAGAVKIFEYGGNNWHLIGGYNGQEDSNEQIGISVAVRNRNEIVTGSGSAQKVVDIKRNNSFLPAVISYLLD